MLHRFVGTALIIFGCSFTAPGCTVDFGSPPQDGDGGFDGGPAVCGNGVLEPGEVCDGTDLGGQTCASAVGHAQGALRCTESCLLDLADCSTCGDGRVEGSEDCDDANRTTDDGCSDLCATEPGWVCTGQPSSCNFTCGNGQLDTGEECDDGNMASADGCSPTCRVETGWSCNGIPSTCEPLCGDNRVVGYEECDDGNQTPQDGCSAYCTIETGWQCEGEPSVCAPLCGDGNIVGTEVCDDGNGENGDGCANDCTVESGWQCEDTPSLCQTVCGDGLIAGQETCDDGNSEESDGCSSQCAVESYAACDGEPSVCVCAVYVNGGSVPDSRDGATWDSAFETIQAGIDQADTLEGCEVWVAAETYHIYQHDVDDCLAIQDTVALYGGFDGNETARSQRDPLQNVTILDGGSSPSSFSKVETIMRIQNASLVTIDGFTFQNTASTTSKGGGMFAKDTSLTVRGCVFSQNSSQAGAAIHVEDVDGQISNCHFSNNEAEDGGAVYIKRGSLTLADSIFESNAASAHGGAINIEHGLHSVMRCAFENNAAAIGGGAIRIYSSSSSVSNCRFWSNSAQWGAGVSINGSIPELINSIFYSNVADKGGGASVYDSYPTFKNCLFYDNTATDTSDPGGGIYTINGSSTTIYNTIIWANLPDGLHVTNDSNVAITHSNAQGDPPGVGNFSADPLFFAPADADFHLTAGSPCIDAADGDESPVLDLDGATRYDDPATANSGAGVVPYCDIGPYEFHP